MALSSLWGTIAVSSKTSASPIAQNSYGQLSHVSSSRNYCRNSSASMNIRCRQEGEYGLCGISNGSVKDQFTKVVSTVTTVAATLLLTSTLNVEAVHALDRVVVGALFQRTCSGCHTGGGNILQPNATLFNKDLDRNGLSSVDDVYNITYFGKNRMPGYGEKCAPRGQCTFGPRLGEDDIRALAEFVKSQADQGWTNVQT